MRLRSLAASAVFLLFGIPLHAAEIKGKLTNVVGGEALGRIQVSVLELKVETTTAADGTFAIRNLPPGNYVLRMNAVGYRLLTVPFALATAEDVKEFSVVMVPDNFRRTDTVEVTADVFQAGDSPAVVEQNLTSSEVREASTVLADDPFRAIQALPGVSAAGNNELLAEFSVMGAPFNEVGIYLDDVLLQSPFHNVPNVQNGASLSLLTSEIVEEMKLLPVAYPEKYGNQIGAALDIRTRDGSRTRPLFRAAVGLGDSDLLGEGRLGRGRRGSWLASARRSYLGYLVRELIRSDFADISFYAGNLKLSYDITPSHTVTFFGLGGHTHVDDSTATTATSVRTASSDFIFLRTGWRWSVNPHLLLDSRVAYLQHPYVQSNPLGQVVSRNSYGEWVVGSDVAWGWSRNSTLDAGWTLRRLADHFTSYNVGLPQGTVVAYASHQDALRGSGFAQQSSNLVGDRLHVMGGVRVDGREDLGMHPFSAQGSAAWGLTRATQLQFGIGRYAQLRFPDFQLGQGTPCSAIEQAYDRSNHFSVAVEHKLGENTRVRVQVFDRQSNDFTVTSGGQQCPIPFVQGMRETGRHYSRGVEVVLQRRSANRLSGWVGYTLARARENFLLNQLPQMPVYSPYFTSYSDQPNSVNAFATYRLKPTVNLSGKLLYGSGFPAVSGLETAVAGGFQPVPVVRLPDYLRVDLRADKCWAFRRWKTTLYGEVLNLTDHDNRIVNFTEFLPNGQAVAHTQRALPITPTAGVVFEF
jgi:hypothetical protein